MKCHLVSCVSCEYTPYIQYLTHVDCIGFCVLLPKGRYSAKFCLNKNTCLFSEKNPALNQAFLFGIYVQPHSDDRLHQPVRSGLHGDSEHTEVRQPSTQHQEQGDGEPRQSQPANQCAEDGDRPIADGAYGVQNSEIISIPQNPQITTF